MGIKIKAMIMRLHDTVTQKNGSLLDTLIPPEVIVLLPPNPAIQPGEVLSCFQWGPDRG
jgi:hypothetical protein